jgi:hypothetical protein
MYPWIEHRHFKIANMPGFLLFCTTANAWNYECLRETKRPPLVSEPYGGTVGWGTALQAGRSRVRFEIFHWYKHSDRNMVLGSTQLLTEMSTRNISCGVKAAGAEFLYVWEPQTPQGLFWDCFTFTFYPFDSILRNMAPEKTIRFDEGI